jgi:PAS domain S-box-containing protein
LFIRLRQVVRDKSEVELKLRASEIRYRTFFEGAPLVGLVWTEGFIITDWNQKAERILGWTRAEVLGRCGFDFLVPAFAQAELQKDMCNFRRTTMLAKNTSTYQTRDGQILTFEWSNVWLEKLLLQEVEIISLGLDITERKKTDAALARTLINVERAEAEQRHLLSVASHEFRTPAAMIKASLDSIAFLKENISPEVTLRLENIYKASRRLISLSNHLISEDRLQAMTLRPQMQNVNLCDLTSEVVSRYAANNNLQLQLPAQAVSIETDPILLSIAIHNLIDNALQNNPQLGQPVVVSLIVSDGIIEIQVADSGPGVPEQDQESVFHRFHSAKGGVSDGLGLSIVYSVARAHGGIAFVYDNIPHGAVFVIHLPGNYQGKIAF